MVSQEPSISWTFDPRRQEPGKFIALVAAIVIVGAVVYFTSDTARPWWTSTSVVLLVLMTLPYFVPITYELSEEGAAVFHGKFRTSFKPWSHYSRCVYDDFGLQLKTMVVETRLDHYRGCFMRFARGAQNRDAVIAYISKRLKTVRNKA